MCPLLIGLFCRSESVRLPVCSDALSQCTGLRGVCHEQHQRESIHPGPADRRVSGLKTDLVTGLTGIHVSLQVGDAWRRLIHVPPVSTLLGAAAPSVDFAWHKYLAAHDAVVSAPTYSR